MIDKEPLLVCDDERVVLLKGQLLRQLRKRSGLSQEALSDLCLQHGLRVSTSSIKRAERGRPVLHRTARALAQYFKIGVPDLVVEPADAAQAAPPKVQQAQGGAVLDLQVLIGGLVLLTDLLRGEHGEVYRRMLVARANKTAAE